MRVHLAGPRVLRLWLTGLAAVFALVVLSSGLATAGGPNQRNLTERKVLKTAYHEPSDTYFQLAADVVNRTGTGRWAYAVQKARTAKYKGRQGRLAKITTASLHNWIVETFDFRSLSETDGVWVGLRYWCSARMLTWSSGETHKAGQFAPWDTPWHRTGNRCGGTETPYMGVAYNPGSRRWQATVHNKRFRYYLIEFPPDQ